MKRSALARRLFLDTLGQLTVSEVMAERIRCVDETLHLGEFACSLEQIHRVVVVAMGKAAAPMWDALLPAIGPGLQRGQTVDGVVVGATPLTQDNGRVRFFQGSHPFPDQGARDAADAVLALLAGTDERCLVVFLISGGASAMVEMALDGRMSVEDETEFYRALVHSGLPIAQMNALRKHFSRVKGGRLAVAAGRAMQCTLLISDVPENMLHVVGSGPSLPDPSTVEECRAMIEANRGGLRLSSKIIEFFFDPGLAETTKGDDVAFAKARWMSLLSSVDLCEKAGRAAAALGFHVVVDNGCDEWEYRQAAEYLIERLRELRREHARVCLLSAGEVSVQIPTVHGMGGRNQQFVVECARLLEGGGMKATVLSGGSDGVDGNSQAAGAVGDETTFARARALGLDAGTALAGFDCYPLFSALEDAIVIGPTGNNVRDLRILLSEG